MPVWRGSDEQPKDHRPGSGGGGEGVATVAAAVAVFFLGFFTPNSECASDIVRGWCKGGRLARKGAEETPAIAIRGGSCCLIPQQCISASPTFHH